MDTKLDNKHCKERQEETVKMPPPTGIHINISAFARISQIVHRATDARPSENKNNMTIITLTINYTCQLCVSFYYLRLANVGKVCLNRGLYLLPTAD